MADPYREVFEALGDGPGAFTTKDIAERVPRFGSNVHQQSGAVRSWLMVLEKRGLVKRLDDQKPVCWLRTGKEYCDG